MQKWNHYGCQTCGRLTIARHDDDGVTPFMLGCYVTPGCPGPAYSNFFAGPQNDDQVAHVVFFRPVSVMAAIVEINKFPRQFRAELLEHYQNGGSLMREVA